MVIALVLVMVFWGIAYENTEVRTWTGISWPHINSTNLAGLTTFLKPVLIKAPPGFRTM
jgi:hypothetical protein